MRISRYLAIGQVDTMSLRSFDWMHMKISLTRVLCALSLAVTGLASAADYPDKPIRLVVPYPPGGASDTVARLIGQQLSQRLKQPVLVDNKPGATEQIGASFVAKAPP